MDCDLLIKNAFIIDGTGNPGFYGELAIKEDKIYKIASKLDLTARRVIDAGNKAVVPGFIDPHTHEELVVLENGNFESFLRQGVTTVINGNCGHSVTPYGSENVYEYMYRNGLMSAKGRNKYQKFPSWNNLSGYIELVKEKGFNINMGILLGHGTIRWSVMGGSKDRVPDSGEKDEIAQIIKTGLQQGALGISTGLSYIPSRYADTEEIIECARIVSEMDGIYTSHIRYYEGKLEAVKEAIQIGKEADVRVQISHMTPTVPEAFQEVLQARSQGVEIAIDTIPKSSGHCTSKGRMLQFIMALSSDLFDKDIAGVKKALQDPEQRQQILEDSVIFKEDFAKTFMINTDDPQLEGRSITELAAEQDKKPGDFLLDILADDELDFTLWLGGYKRSDFPGKPYDDSIATNPLVMVGSDRIFGEGDDRTDWYELFRPGAFPIFCQLMTEKGVRVEEIIRRLTSLPAQQFRLQGRGLLQAGLKADIAVIDLEQYSYPGEEEIDYSNPETVAGGVEYVIVGGKTVLAAGEVKQVNCGKFLGLNGREI